MRGLHFAQRLSFLDPLSWRDSIKAWRQAGELGISVLDASRQLVDHTGSMTAYEWDAQIKSIMAHGGRLTVDLVAADFLFTGVSEGSAVFKNRAEQAIRSIPPEQLHKLSQSLGKTRLLWDKVSEAFALKRSPVPALAGEAGALEGVSLAERDAKAIEIGVDGLPNDINVKNLVSDASQNLNVYTHKFKYHSRIMARAVQDPLSHNFPYSFDDYILKVKPIFQRDGSLLYRLEGTLNKKPGFFEIALTPESETIFHRCFVGIK